MTLSLSETVVLPPDTWKRWIYMAGGSSSSHASAVVSGDNFGSWPNLHSTQKHLSSFMQTLRCQEQQHMAPYEFLWSGFAHLGKTMLALTCKSNGSRLVRKETKVLMWHRVVKQHFMHKLSFSVKTALFYFWENIRKRQEKVNIS